jgi:antitoxin component of RelBE/YafQ-DinJ toxin-antitoxin module
MSQTIYARVPDEIKEAADAYASDGGMTLANAVADLLDRGLQAVADEGLIAELEARVAQLNAENDRLKQRDQAASSVYQALAQRTAQPVGACPKCDGSISGYDLLVSGRCARPDCGASLTPLLGVPAGASSAKGRLDDGEFKVLLGALGLALGIAYISQQAGGG